MSYDESSTSGGFERELGRLLGRIDLVPLEQRPHLHELADVISRQHRQLQDEVQSLCPIE
jgi:hypothetical protein